jgi:hypothetical protein
MPRRLTVDLDSPGIHYSLKVKFSFQDRSEKQNGRILMKYDHRRAKILFLTPLNQIYFKLLVENDRAVLINTKKKICWEGEFRRLLREMWRIDLSFPELRLLIEKGTVPRRRFEKNNLEYSLERDDKTGQPEKLRLFNDEISIQLRIQNRKTKKGAIEFLDICTVLKSGELKDVIRVE